MTVDRLTWLSGLRPGDPVLVVRFVPAEGSALAADRVTLVQVEEDVVSRATGTQVVVSGAGFRRQENGSGPAGWATDRRRLEPPADLGLWRRVERQRRALARLSRIDALASTSLGMLRRELVSVPDGLDASEEIVVALERMAEAWDEFNAVGTRAAELLSQQSREWWDAVPRTPKRG
ncbi:hypothetical protein DAETH_48420 (plasmid) [Deinococcus aetherius]|uniref:Uncharacterized protein n=1 Tax=Deinococcus aetherius TaxID=200252 RepID=A0ABM8ALZ9_9DEIO|nr:hypothetical protein [Deinococcus aetherius]BDP44873.1 hypothetical protein DAETH_48420 [Deinococcus aetherius]